MPKRKRENEEEYMGYDTRYTTGYDIGYTTEFKVDQAVEKEMRSVFLYLESILDYIQNNGESRDMIYIEINKVSMHQGLGSFLGNLMRNMEYTNLENFIRTMTV